MPKILENNEIEFSIEDIESAWQNAPCLINKDQQQYRMCFICKFFMKKENFNKNEFGWICEFINLKSINLDKNNLIAIHPECRDLRFKDDCSKIIKKIKNKQWSAI